MKRDRIEVNDRQVIAMHALVLLVHHVSTCLLNNYLYVCACAHACVCVCVCVCMSVCRCLCACMCLSYPILLIIL